MASTLSATDLADLARLEEAMWRDETRCDRHWMAAHITADFVEFGASGRTYDRAEILEQSPSPIEAVLPLADYRVVALADDVALATYVSDAGGRRANRSSLWVHTAAGWLLRFHQGTVIA